MPVVTGTGVSISSGRGTVTVNSQTSDVILSGTNPTKNVGPIVGPAGPTGPQGPAGPAGSASNVISFNTQTGSYVLQSSDNNEFIVINSTVAVNVIVPAGLSSGFRCVLVQGGPGTLTIVGSNNTVSISNWQNQFTTAGQYAMTTLLQVASNTYYFDGSTTVPMTNGGTNVNGTLDFTSDGNFTLTML